MVFKVFQNAVASVFKPITQAGASVTKSVQATARGGYSAGGPIGSTAMKAAKLSQSISSVSKPVVSMVTKAPGLSHIAQMGAASVPKLTSVPKPVISTSKPITSASKPVTPMITKRQGTTPSVNMTSAMNRLSKSVESVVKSPILSPVRQAGGDTMTQFVNRVTPPSRGGASLATIPASNMQDESSMASRMLDRQNRQAKRMVR